MKILGDSIAVKQHLTEEVSQGGIIMAGDQKSLPQGEVKFIGPDVKTVAIGDVVYFNAFAGQDLVVGDSQYRVMPIEDVLAVLEEGDLS